MTPATILSLRLRRCFFERAALPRGREPPFREPPPAPAGRLPVGRPPAGRPDDPAPVRAAVVRARPPAGGLRAPLPPAPRPPPPVLRVRAGGGRRTDPARGATGEVSSWDGTREPLSDCRVRRRGGPCRSSASSAVGVRVSATRHPTRA